MSVAVAGDAIYFNRPLRDPRELWISDGTVSGTYLLLDGSSGLGVAQIGEVAALDDQAFFIAELETGAHSLWVTGGTLETTHLITVLEAQVGWTRPGNSGRRLSPFCSGWRVHMDFGRHYRGDI